MEIEEYNGIINNYVVKIDKLFDLFTEKLDLINKISDDYERNKKFGEELNLFSEIFKPFMAIISAAEKVKEHKSSEKDSNVGSLHQAGMSIDKAVVDIKEWMNEPHKMYDEKGERVFHIGESLKLVENSGANSTSKTFWRVINEHGVMREIRDDIGDITEEKLLEGLEFEKSFLI